MVYIYVCVCVFSQPFRVPLKCFLALVTGKYEIDLQIPLTSMYVLPAYHILKSGGAYQPAYGCFFICAYITLKTKKRYNPEGSLASIPSSKLGT